jgi:mRNA interferase MazF
VLRGDVHAINLPRGRGRAQHGRRYGVIIQADELATLSTVMICPTSQSATPTSFRPQIELGESRTQVLCEMALAVDTRSLGERVGHLSLDDLNAVDDALRLIFNLSR